MDWYKLEVAEILRHLSATEHGLTTEEARARLAEHGPNIIAEEGGPSPWKIFLHQFTSPLIYILLIAAVVTVVLQEYKDAGVIAAIVLLNAVVGFFQEYKAEESVLALKKMVVPKARVLRDGHEKEILSADLVPGDIVLIESGLRIPADLRLFRTVELRVDEALLTGESIPVGKSAPALKEDNLTPGDQKNMAFMGTIAVTGRARGLVVATGARSLLGSIAEQVQEITKTRAPLQEKFDRFANIIGLIILVASAALFGLGLMVGESPTDMFMTAVAAAVATIPEGLPIVVTITLAISVARMARRNAIIRKLPAVETLGSTTVICSDKTGTLTKNEMTVKLIFDGEHVFEVTGSGYEPKGEILKSWLPMEPQFRGDLAQVLRIGMLCNESEVYEEEGQYKVSGDPTEAALLVSAMKGGLDPETEKERYSQKAIIPFESEFGYMATLHEHQGKKYVFVKGAPEKLISRCTECLKGNGDKLKTIMAVADNFAKDGLRVLAMAYREVGPEVEEITHRDLEGDLVIAGLQGMIDPPREEVVEAVKGCKQAGVRVIMITGDHAVTAQAIARKLGIGGENPQTMTGREIEAISDEELFNLLKEVSIFARVAPDHKLRIVQQLVAHGDIVAVTGDGVNDAPALKAAHIGVAMGKTGTDVAKEASDMVIADDNFANIFAAVKEGRVVFDNIRKVTFFLIPTGIAAILTIIGTVILGLPMPFVPAQLLWINLVSNGLQDVALAFEPGEKDIDHRPPRDPKEGIMSRVLVQRTIIVGALISVGVIVKFVYGLTHGESLEHARTMAVTTMVFFQFFQCWNSRSEYQSVFTISPFSNPFLLYALIAATFAQLAVIYAPPLQWIFRTAPLSVFDWVLLLGISVTVVLVVEIDKMVRRRAQRQEFDKMGFSHA